MQKGFCERFIFLPVRNNRSLRARRGTNWNGFVRDFLYQGRRKRIWNRNEIFLAIR